MSDSTGAEPTDRPAAKTSRGRATRQILLASTIKLVALEGYAATTTQAVLDDTGVSRGSLLNQFPTRDALMVATAEAAMSHMLEATEDGLQRHADLLKGMMDFPNVLWRVQNDLPARAFTEIQLASRWDASLRHGLRRAMADMNALTTSKIRQAAEQFAIDDVPGLLNETYLLISATQGLAIGRDLVDDKAMTTAGIALLRNRFVASLKARLPGGS